MDKKNRSYLIKNIILLLASLLIGGGAAGFLGKSGFMVLAIIIFAIMIFLVTFAIKNMITIVAAMIVTKKMNSKDEKK